MNKQETNWGLFLIAAAVLMGWWFSFNPQGTIPSLPEAQIECQELNPQDQCKNGVLFDRRTGKPMK